MVLSSKNSVSTLDDYYVVYELDGRYVAGYVERGVVRDPQSFEDNRDAKLRVLQMMLDTAQVLVRKTCSLLTKRAVGSSEAVRSLLSTVPTLLPPSSTIYSKLRSLSLLDTILCNEPNLRIYTFFLRDLTLNQASFRINCGLNHSLYGATDDSKSILQITSDQGGDQCNRTLSAPAELQVLLTFLGRYGIMQRFYQTSSEAEWTIAGTSDPQQSAMLLALLNVNSEDYARLARLYYELDTPVPAVDQILSGVALTPDLVEALSPGFTFVEAAQAAVEVGYPVKSV